MFSFGNMTYLRVGYLIKNRTELGYITKYDEVVGGEGLTNERLTSGEKGITFCEKVFFFFSNML